MNTSDLIIVLITSVIFTLFSGFYSIKSWKDPVALRKWTQKKIDKSPSWVPNAMKEITASRIKGKAWLWQTRFFSTLGLAMGPIIIVLSVYAWLKNR